MRPIILKDEKVSLGILLKEDLLKSWKWFNDRSTVKYMFNSAYFTLQEEEEEFYKELKKNKDKAPVFAVVKNGDEKFVGVAGFNWINWQARWGGYSTISPPTKGERATEPKLSSYSVNTPSGNSTFARSGQRFMPITNPR